MASLDSEPIGGGDLVLRFHLRALLVSLVLVHPALDRDLDDANDGSVVLDWLTVQQAVNLAGNVVQVVVDSVVGFKGVNFR